MFCTNQRYTSIGVQGDCVPRTSRPTAPRNTNTSSKPNSCTYLTRDLCNIANPGQSCVVRGSGLGCYCHCYNTKTGQIGNTSSAPRDNKTNNGGCINCNLLNRAWQQIWGLPDDCCKDLDGNENKDFGKVPGTSASKSTNRRTTASTGASICDNMNTDPFTKMSKFFAGCPGPESNTLLAPHDQDCTNYLGFGGLLDGFCVSGKGAAKGGANLAEWMPVIVGGGLIIIIALAMK